MDLGQLKSAYQWSEVINHMRRALCVGINAYSFGALHGCVSDAERIASLLTRHEDGSPNFECRLLVAPNGAPEDLVTRAKLRQEIERLFKDKAEVALLFFSGHGTENDLGGYLVTQDAESYDEGVSMTDVLKMANDSAADEVVILIDCCHAGNLGNLPALDNTKALLRDGVSILTASRGDQVSVEAHGADLFTSRLSFVILLTGLVWTFFGALLLRQVVFPILILLLAIPFPAIVFNQITFPLQLLASRMASMILPLLGVPVLQEGNVIELPVMKLEVAEACSGIRSLMSLFTLAIFYGYFLERTTTRRVILALASIPIAVAANAIRIVGTGLCVQYWDPVKALGFFHEFSGWVMFVISLACLYLIHHFMRVVAPPKEVIA